MLSLPRDPITERPRVTVVVPMRNEERFIGQFLDNLCAQHYPADHMEVFLVDGQSSDRTVALAEAFRPKLPDLKICPNPDRERPVALNIGLEKATGDLVVIMDVHVRYPPEYISGLVACLRETGADYVGGRIDTAPGADTFVAQAVALALSHPFGAGGSTFRTSAESREGFAPFGCYRRGLPFVVGGYNERLPRSDDNEFMARLARAGGKNWICGQICSTYFARSTLRQLCRQMHGNGASHVSTCMELPGQFQWHHLVPFGFVTVLALSIILTFVTSWGWILWPAVLGPYLLLDLLSSIQVSRRAGCRYFVPMLLLFMLIHIVYGLGTWWGLFAFGVFKAHRRPGRRTGMHLLASAPRTGQLSDRSAQTAP